MAIDPLLITDGPTFDRPGPFISKDAFGNARSLYIAARPALFEWIDLREAAYERLPELLPVNLYATGENLIWQAHKSGLRSWCEQCRVPSLYLKSIDDLRWWCKLQYEVLATIPCAYPAPRRALNSGSEITRAPWDEGDEAVIRLAIPLLYHCAPYEEWVEDVSEFGGATTSREWIFETNSRFQLNRHSKEMIPLAWSYIRHLGQSYPPEPDILLVSDGASIRKLLDSVVAWCDVSESPGTLVNGGVAVSSNDTAGPEPDGPFPPFKFRYGEKIAKMQPRPFWLLSLIWSDERVQVADAEQVIWGDESENDTRLKSALHRINATLTSVGFPKSVIKRREWLCLE